MAGLACGVTLGKVPKLSEPQFPCLLHGFNGVASRGVVKRIKKDNNVKYLAQNLASNKHIVNGNHVYYYLAVRSSQPFTSTGLGFLIGKPVGWGGARTIRSWKIPSRSGILWFCVHVIGEGARRTWYRALKHVLFWNS